MAYISINVDLGDVYDDLSRSEKITLMEYLEDDGIIEDQRLYNEETNNKLINEEFMDSCVKLGTCYYQMSKEDEEVVNNLVKKYS